jgi:beta-lactam-binding protein with PASTA domain
VIGYTETAAKSALTGVGFKVSVTQQPSSTVAAGDVINQAPNGGGNAPYGSTVTITVATAPTTQQVPPVVGFTASAATTQLTGDGFKVTATKQTVAQQNEDGIVLSESPGSGSTQKKGSKVTIVVGHYVRSSQTRTTSTTPTTTTTTTTSTATTPILNPITTTTSTGTTPTTTTSTTTTPTTTTSTGTTTTTTPTTTTTTQ